MIELQMQLISQDPGWKQPNEAQSLTRCQETEPVGLKPHHHHPPPSTPKTMRFHAQGCQNKWSDRVFALLAEECSRCSLEPRGFFGSHNTRCPSLHHSETCTSPGIQCTCTSEVQTDSEMRGGSDHCRGQLGHFFGWY